VRNLRGVALDTGIENRAARALYQRSGFEQRGLRPVPDERSARAIGGSGFVGYVKRR
jgi:ribosomal protein S18 acetylase RimI-like enzyme